MKITEEELDYCLDSLALNELDSVKVSSRLLKRFANILVESNSNYQTVCAQMKSEFALVSATFRAEISEISKSVLDDFDQRMKIHLAHVNLKADEAMESIRANLQKSKERIDAASVESQTE